ncbi:MAG TPA: hypothetical protein VII13_16830 [Vicinamibacteria bacterium]|jgi:hypothetical protein
MKAFLRLAAASGLALAGLSPAPASEPEARPDVPSRLEPSDSLPVVREQRYRMVAAIRPLLFWTRASTVGGVQLVWRQGEGGRRGYELLLGSDPGRAPLKINRWGWAREEGDEAGSVMLGLMKQTTEESVEEARTRLATEGKDGHVFKIIRTRVADGEARAVSTTALTARDYTYRDLDEVRAVLEATPATPRIRSARLPGGTRPGFLFALGDLIHETVETARAAGGRWKAPGRTMVTFTFNAALYDLTLRSAEYLAAESYGGRRFERVVRMDFESVKRASRTRDRFTLVVGTEEPWTEVPVFVRYQPKWWLRTEGVLDEREQF